MFGFQGVELTDGPLFRSFDVRHNEHLHLTLIYSFALPIICVCFLLQSLPILYQSVLQMNANIPCHEDLQQPDLAQDLLPLNSSFDHVLC